MKTMNINSVYTAQIQSMIHENGLSEDYGAEVQTCSTMSEVFAALSNKAAKHVALLTEHGRPIENMFEYIKEQLAAKRSVALALFFERDDEPILN